jgi:hypothetical protein
MCAVLAFKDLEGSWLIGGLQMCLRFGRLIADLSIKIGKLNNFVFGATCWIQNNISMAL